MPGKIIAVLVEPGDRVERDAPLLILEAMKMEHTIRAPARGRIARILCRVGEQVVEGAELIDFEVES
jgi:3-methylcrotonyl-CoA carboxylase alpha subunit